MFFVAFCCFFLQEYIAKVYRRFFVKEVTVEKTVPIFVEKEIPMIAVDRSEAHVYRLEDDLFFNADSGVLYRVDNRGEVDGNPCKTAASLLGCGRL